LALIEKKRMCVDSCLLSNHQMGLTTNIILFCGGRGSRNFCPWRQSLIINSCWT